MPMPRDVVLVLSGGMDSSTLLYDLLDKGNRVWTLTVDYGQRHRRELDAARAVAAEADRVYSGQVLGATVLDLAPLRALFAGSGSSQVEEGVAVPHGHYAEESMKTTVVPNRNMILLALATALALSRQCDSIAYAAHAGDHAIYPDCRPEFVTALQGAIDLCDWHRVEILRPYLPLDKGDILAVGIPLGVPYHLTWTCYEGRALACGRCGACQERLEAFRKMGVVDPLDYAPEGG